MNATAQSTDKTLTIFHFNDVYNIEPGSNEPLGGAARLVTAYQNIQDRNPMVLFSGDCLNPSLISIMERGNQMLPVFNGVGVTCAVLGNHEFDFGLEVLEEFMGKCKFPWLLSNVLDKHTGQPLAGAKETHLINWNGVAMVGFIGMAEEEWLGTLPKMDTSDMIFLDYVQTAQNLCKQLREQGADLVIALTHMSMKNDQHLLAEVKDIDIIFGGHDHHYVTEQIDNRYIVKSGTDFQNASIITLYLDTDNSLLPVMPNHIEKLVLDSSVPENANMKSIVDGYLESLDEMTRTVLGHSNADLDGLFEHIRAGETALGNLVADLMARSMDTDVAIINSGTFRSNCIHPRGEFTARDLFRMLPLFDQLCVLELTGMELHRALENGVSMYPELAGRFPQVSGVQFQVDPQREPGERIDAQTVLVKGRPLQYDKIYRVCVKEYIASGKDGYDILRSCPHIVSPKSGPQLSAIVRSYFEGSLHCSDRFCNKMNEEPHNIPLHNKDKVKFTPKIEGRIIIFTGDTKKADEIAGDINGNISRDLIADE
ncbi:mannosylglucosyl-3-phosphoglycerate phosphatase-like [Watersipora subatra]|uniref:mannosylglucosyl-3-phosphoglycerate phosphatase-like n=1 Tax=Watersipora subatra TaxID=2589382 RepID=UPI00355BF0C2